MALTSGGLNVYSHISYKPLQNCDYRQKKNFTKQLFYARIKVPIVYISYMGFSKFYYSLLDLTKVMISAYFNVIIYIGFELFTY